MRVDDNHQKIAVLCPACNYSMTPNLKTQAKSLFNCSHDTDVRGRLECGLGGGSDQGGQMSDMVAALQPRPRSMYATGHLLGGFD